MISFKEYAKNKGCSYEAVRQQVRRYKNDLNGHITKVGKTQYLDDDAVIFLDSKRKTNPVIILEVEKDETIKRLEEENKALLLKVATLQEELLKEKDLVKELQEEKIMLLEQKEERSDPKRKETFFSRLFGKGRQTKERSEE